MLSISYTIMAFLFSIILIIVYFAKDRINYVENKVYSFIIMTSFFSCLIEIISFCEVQMGFPADNPIYHITIKALFLCFLAWIYLFTLYTIITGKKLRGVFSEKTFPTKKLSLGFVLVALVVMFLPIEILETNGLLLPVGTSVTIIYLLAGACIVTMIISVIINRKNLMSHKYAPLYLVIIFFTIAVAAQKLFPELFLINSAFSLISFCMYFTIENPDMKMVEELIENRKMIERHSEEKSVFLFKISQSLREPVKNIDNLVDLYNAGHTTKKEIQDIINGIDENNKKMNYLINDVLGISSFDNSSMKKMENTYNIYSLLEDINKRTKNNIKEGVDYQFTVADNMPKELYGDSIKLKQVLMSILMNSIKNAKKGFISVDVNSFTKYDVCRLIITVENSDIEIGMVEINRILEQELELTDKDHLKIEKSDIDLHLAYKLIRMLGGTMHIKSIDKKGTEIIITIDQYIVMNEEIMLNSKVDSYIKTRNTLKKILVVNDDEKEIKRIRTNLERRGYDVVISMFGQDAIDRIRNNERYDIVLIDDEMPMMNGINVLQELIKLKNKSKKIVLLGKDKLFISHHYIKDGFDDYIDKEELVKELNKKIK